LGNHCIGIATASSYVLKDVSTIHKNGRSIVAAPAISTIWTTSLPAEKRMRLFTFSPPFPDILIYS